MTKYVLTDETRRLLRNAPPRNTLIEDARLMEIASKWKRSIMQREHTSFPSGQLMRLEAHEDGRVSIALINHSPVYSEVCISMTPDDAREVAIQILDKCARAEDKVYPSTHEKAA